MWTIVCIVCPGKFVEAYFVYVCYYSGRKGVLELKRNSLSVNVFHEMHISFIHNEYFKYNNF